MRVAIASEGYPPYPIDTSMYTHTRDALDAVRRAGVDAFVLALPSNRGARIGGLVRPYLRRKLAGYAGRDGAEVVHHISQDVRRGADVATVHDLYPFYDVDGRTSDAFFREAIRTALKRPARVVVTTEHTRREVAARFPEHAEKLRVVPVPHRTPPPGLADPVRYDALWVGRNAPNKNLPLYLALAVRYPALRFALRSSRSPDREALDREVAWKLAAARNVAVLPRQSEEGLDALYRSARVLVVTSNYEGFHVPAMEAYVRGARVVLPRIEPYLELYGGEGTVNTYWYDPAWIERPFAWDFSRSLANLAAAFEEACANPTATRAPDARVVARVSLESVGWGLKAVYEEVARR